MKFSTILAASALASISLFTTGCKKDTTDPSGPGTLTAEFDNIYGDDELTLGAQYTNATGEQLTIDMLQYYVSNISLRRSDGSVYTVPQDSSYFLVREADTESQEIHLNNVPAGAYNGITFTIGVDSLRSRMAPAFRKGVLDVGDEETGQSMFVNDTLGYMGYLLTGRSPQSPYLRSGVKSFWYGIAGYGGTPTQPTENNVRTITLAFPQEVQVKSGVTPEAHIVYDAKKVWDGAARISVATQPTAIYTAGSVPIVGNYATAFSVAHVHQM